MISFEHALSKLLFLAKKFPFFSAQIRSSVEITWDVVRKAIFRIHKKRQIKLVEQSELRFDMISALFFLASKASNEAEKNKLLDLTKASDLQKRKFLSRLYESLQAPQNLNPEHWLFRKISSSPHVLRRILKQSLEPPFMVDCKK